MPKLTSTLVKSLEPGLKDKLVWDNEIKGFHCKITPKGKRVFLYYYLTKDFRQRRPVIGVFGTMTCDQARLIAIEWQAEIAKGGDPSADKSTRRHMVTVKELSERYLKEHAKTQKKPSSAKIDESMWQNYILPRIGNCKVSSVTRNDIATIHAALSHVPTAANRCLALLSKAFNLAELWNYRPDNTNPCRHLKRYAEKKRKRYLSMEEIKTLNSVLNNCEANKTILPSAAAAIRLIMFTGSRLSEILTLKWQYVDLDNRLLNLPDSKTGEKFVYLPLDAITILETLFENPQRNPANPYVIVGREENTHLVNLEKSWCRVRKLAKIEDVRMHDLRHTFASIAVANGLSLPIIGGLLGHSQTSTTARYAHLNNSALKEAVSLIGNAISTAMEEKKMDVIKAD
jgi:integrase